MSNMNKRDFLNTKLQNFKKFISENIPAADNKFKQDLMMLCSVSVEDFSTYILIKVKPFKDNINDYVQKMAQEYNINIGT